MLNITEVYETGGERGAKVIEEMKEIQHDKFLSSQTHLRFGLRERWKLERYVFVHLCLCLSPLSSSPP